MSRLIERFREAYKGKSDQELTKLYFSLMGKAEECKRNKDWKGMMKYAVGMLSLIEPLIRDFTSDGSKFIITEIPPIDWTYPYYAVTDARGQLMNLKEVIYYFPELERWKPTIDRAFAMLETANRIYKFLKENDGFIQKNLKKAIGAEDGFLIRDTCHYMEKVGRLKRVKSGNSYALSIQKHEYKKTTSK